MVIPGFSPAAGLRCAGAMRAELAPLLAADPAHPLPLPLAQNAYRLLRCAENLELYCALLQFPARPKPLDLAAVLTALCTAAKEVLPGPPAALRLCCPASPVPVLANEAALYKAVLNLVCNSLVFGGPSPAIALRLVRQGSRAVLFMADNGPGIPPGRQHKALAPFESGSALPAFGLGLPLAALFARRSRGAFTLESRPGQGLRAAISLPLFPTPRPLAAPDAAALLADRFSPVYVQLSPRCILPD